MLLLKVKDLLVSYSYCYHERVMFSIDIIKFKWFVICKNIIDKYFLNEFYQKRL